MKSNIVLRAALPADDGSIHLVLTAAFPTEAEARLVENLREYGHAVISIVAVVNDLVVGHVLFSPVKIVDLQGGVLAQGLGLAPLAVLPDWQRQGIGQQLVEQGLAVCRERNHPFVVVLGDAAYYGRLGFERASLFGVTNEYETDEYFLLYPCSSQPLPAGLARYGAEFAELK